MEGLEAIKKRIIADAREEADSVRRQAEKTAAEILAGQDEDSQRIFAEARVRGEAQAEAIIGRARSLSALDRRKALLSARQELIDKVLQRVLDCLCQLPAEEKIAFYRQLIKKSGFKEGTVILTKTDHELASRLLADGATDLTLFAEVGSFSGGLILQHGLIEENLTFEMLIENNRATWVSLAASVLFKRDVRQAEDNMGRDQT